MRAMDDPRPLRLLLELDTTGNLIAGRVAVVGESADAIPFRGWLTLAAALQRLGDERSAPPA
jgi:hypothetical protein